MPIHANNFIVNGHVVISNSVAVDSDYKDDVLTDADLKESIKEDNQTKTVHNFGIFKKADASASNNVLIINGKEKKISEHSAYLLNMLSS